MLFNSFQFFLFFPIVTILYFLLPHSYRWFLLLAASCFFYMVFIPLYILILIFTIIIDYFAGIYLEKIKDPSKRKKFLILSLVVNIGILAVFKYYNFFIDNFNEVIHWMGFKSQMYYLEIILPIGLSFHTFQAMSYTIEVYRGNQKAEKHFGIYALYVMFYPQLVAGPIERPQNILHQFREKQPLLYENVSAGLKQMLWGLAKKVIIADRLSVVVDAVYQDPSQHNSLSLIIATWLFAFQIYCDFSGYSDIALGAARVMGFRLMENFRTPYVATSVKKFWERWHISLSTWFRDYLYIPLGGNRVSRQRWYFNLFIVFAISGFWHGAKWTFITWGALHGLYLVIGALVKPEQRNFIPKGRWVKLLALFFTFNLVCLGWIFFRADSMNDALQVLQGIAELKGGFSLSFAKEVNINFFIVSVFLLLLFLAADPFIDELVKGRRQIFSKNLRYALFGFILALFVLFGHFGNLNFIYFQF